MKFLQGQARSSKKSTTSVQVADNPTKMIPIHLIRSEDEHDTSLSKETKSYLAYARQIKDMRERLKMVVPVVTKEHLRRYRMFDAESVVLALETDGDKWAASLLCQFIRMDEVVREGLPRTRGPAKVLRRPALTRCPDLLHALALGLSAANAAKERLDNGAAGAQLLNLAETVWRRGLAWWWLAEGLFLVACEQGRDWTADGGLIDASIALSYGAFLQYELHESSEAVVHLTRATELSAGKSWLMAPSLQRLLPPPLGVLGQGMDQKDNPDSEDSEPAPLESKVLFEAANLACTEALLQDARRERKAGQHENAARILRNALRMAKNARNADLERAAQLELGIAYLTAGEGHQREAIAAFRVFLLLAKGAGCAQDIVVAHIKLALCHHSLHSPNDTLKELHEARSAAQNKDQVRLLAETHKYLGQFFLNTTRPHYATTHFNLAFELYSSSLENVTLGDKVRVQAGVAGGIELIPFMMSLVAGASPDAVPASRRERLFSLIDWKDSHSPFWPPNVPVSSAIRQLDSTTPKPEEALQPRKERRHTAETVETVFRAIIPEEDDEEREAEPEGQS